ncbi:MAG: hypothetical protein MRJ65_06625 [Candidatus Brocadiaceae bacterium]|nr:hypothetical protein [Candidatus Brocadiaceae bacterium]
MIRIALISCMFWLFFTGCKKSETEVAEKKSVIGDIAAVLNPRVKRNQDRPWVLWQWFTGTRYDTSSHKLTQAVGIAAALGELEKFRINLVANNMHDTNGAWGDRGQQTGDEQRVVWKAMQDGSSCGERSLKNPAYRARTLDGRCNDFENPLMGSVGQRFGRNVTIETANNSIVDFNRGVNASQDAGGPNPRVISERLLVRKDPFNHHAAPFFNLWAAAWIQFMTHDWFSHTRDGLNDNDDTFFVSETELQNLVKVGQEGGWEVARTPDDDQKDLAGLENIPVKTWKNTVTFWWDASQLYGWDQETRQRVVAPEDKAKLKVSSAGTLPSYSEVGLTPPKGFLDQEISAFADNWWIGLSLMHTMFSKEHNFIVDQLRQNATPPSGAATWNDEELYDTARLIISALLAKIHTIEWTPQLLYNRLGDMAMHTNWKGILGSLQGDSLFLKEIMRIAKEGSRETINSFIVKLQNFRKDELVSLAVTGTGIMGMPRAEHFGVPYTLTEAFTSVYRLHPTIPDFLAVYDAEVLSQGRLRQLSGGELENKVPGIKIVQDQIAVVDTIREGSKHFMRGIGIDSIALSFGLTGCGQLTLGNFPRFMTELEVPQAPGGKIDLAAMDIIRDRERGVPRFNEFRRQLQLKPLKDFSDFIDEELAWEIENKKTRDFRNGPDLTSAELEAKQAELKRQQQFVEEMRRVYNNDIEKVDLLVGILAEFSRPHGFVISETQFQVFILNASRRLFSDRFFTEHFRPEFYTQWGFDYVNTTTMVDVIKRQFPKLRPALRNVQNPFDLWDRQRSDFALAYQKREDFLPKSN